MTNLARLMDLKETLQQTRSSAAADIAGATDLEALSAVESSLIGRGSVIAGARAGLREMDDAERREMGAFINEIATSIQALVAERRRALEIEQEAASLAADRIDVTLPGRVPPRGTRHLVTQAMDEIVDIFTSIGYSVATGPEAETEFYNFTALNIPPTHPARGESDTLYLGYEDEPEGVLLRTHTSPMQARYMEKNDPPVYIVVPGKVFRRDSLDPTHSPVFHQVEGLAVDENITFGDLKGTLTYFAQQFFGPKQITRFLPNHFPFTEPSAEMHVSCFACDQAGCRICSNTGWIELLGCGMVHPAVFEAVGYDPSTVTGFAFGMGADRVAMVRHGITDLRHYFESDVRVLEQFR